MDPKRLWDRDHKQLTAVFECQIEEGKVHGFGRVVSGVFHSNYIGYFDKGHTVGVGIQFDHEIKTSFQGVFDYLMNVEHKNIEKIRLNKNVSAGALREFRIKEI